MDKQPDTTPAPSRSGSDDSIRVLLVDDESTTYDWLSFVVEGVPAVELAYAPTLEEAFSYLSKARAVDFVLLDLTIQMREGSPQLRGANTLHAFQEQMPHMPVVVLTNDASEHLRAELLDEGAYGYLVKYSMPESEMVRLFISIGNTLRAAFRLPNETEVFRRATQAYVSLSSVLNKPGATSIQLISAMAHLQLMQAEGNAVILAKLNELLEKK